MDHRDEPVRPPDRRTFLQRSGLALSALALGCEPSDDAASAPDSPRPVLEPALLRAVAGVVLPAELGEEERERVVAAFERWVEGYDPVPERVHGYGSQEIRYGPADPTPRWAAQLDALDLEARKRHGSRLTELGVEERRRLVEARLSGAPARLPDRPGALEADHVAIGLLAWFFGGPAATDLCYGRRIGGLSCRPLASSGDRPAPVEGGVAARGPAGPPTSLAVRSPDVDPQAEPAS